MAISPLGYGGWKALGETLHNHPFRIAAVCLVLSVCTSGPVRVETSHVILDFYDSGAELVPTNGVISNSPIKTPYLVFVVGTIRFYIADQFRGNVLPVTP